MLWFNFILGLNFIFVYSVVWQCVISSLKQRKIQFKPEFKFCLFKLILSAFSI